MMNKRDALQGFLSGAASDYTPAAFFLHFDAAFQSGQAAIDKHLEFFRGTDMDFVKIQYERTFPRVGVTRPEDWAKMPLLGRDFYEPQLAVVAGLVERAKAEAPVIITLYSPFMCAGHYGGDAALTEHLKQDPDSVRNGLEIATDSLAIFVKECIRLGVDGFYHSTQGGETGRFAGTRIFADYIRPFDLALMGEANRACSMNILHVCDYHRAAYGGYDDLSIFADYPGQIVNCSPENGGKPVSYAEVSRIFGRPFMGGMDRHGPLSSGTPDQASEAARAVLRAASEPIILAADCTVPGNTPWENLRAAIEAAHKGRE